MDNINAKAQLMGDIKQQTMDMFFNMLHAFNCEQIQNTACTLPHCKPFKALLIHMSSCQFRYLCIYPHCIYARRIVDHPLDCAKKDCSICGAMKAGGDQSFLASFTNHPEDQVIRELNIGSVFAVIN